MGKAACKDLGDFSCGDAEGNAITQIEEGKTAKECRCAEAGKVALKEDKEDAEFAGNEVELACKGGTVESAAFCVKAEGECDDTSIPDAPNNRREFHKAFFIFLVIIYFHFLNFLLQPTLELRKRLILKHCAVKWIKSYGYTTLQIYRHLLIYQYQRKGFMNSAPGSRSRQA